MTDTFDENPSKKKGISFNQFAEVYKVVPRRSMYSAEEKKATWSEKTDYDSFKKDVRSTVKKLEQGRRTSDAFNTTLGVAHMTSEGRKARAKKRLEAWDAVLNEQDTQEQMGRRDSRMLASLYRNVAAESEQEALAKAQRAAMEVAEIYGAHTVDDIDVMEPSNRLQADSRRRSLSVDAMDLQSVLQQLGQSSTSLDADDASDSNLSGL